MKKIGFVEVCARIANIVINNKGPFKWIANRKKVVFFPKKNSKLVYHMYTQ